MSTKRRIFQTANENIAVKFTGSFTNSSLCCSFKFFLFMLYSGRSARVLKFIKLLVIQYHSQVHCSSVKFYILLYLGRSARLLKFIKLLVIQYHSQVHCSSVKFYILLYSGRSARVLKFIKLLIIQYHSLTSTLFFIQVLHFVIFGTFCKSFEIYQVADLS